MKPLDIFCHGRKAWIGSVRNDIEELRRSIQANDIEGVFDGRLAALESYLVAAEDRITDAVHCPHEVWMEIEGRVTDSYVRLQREILAENRAEASIPA